MLLGHSSSCYTASIKSIINCKRSVFNFCYFILGNPKKCKKLLEKGKLFCAEPEHLLETALLNFKSGNNQLIDEETEEHTFAELISKNTSKTDDFTTDNSLTRAVKHHASDSSIGSTSSSSTDPFSPENLVSTTESSSDVTGETISMDNKPLERKLSSITELGPVPEGKYF